MITLTAFRIRYTHCRETIERADEFDLETDDPVKAIGHMAHVCDDCIGEDERIVFDTEVTG